MNIRSALVIAVAATLFACDSDDDDDGANVAADINGTDEPEATVASDFNGTYVLTATPTTPFANDGGACNIGRGEIMVLDGVITGSALTDNTAIAFEVTGGVDDAGQVAGGFATAGQQVVTYTGGFEMDAFSGDWQDAFECRGTWEGVLQ